MIGNPGALGTDPERWASAFIEDYQQRHRTAPRNFATPAHAVSDREFAVAWFTQALAAGRLGEAQEQGFRAAQAEAVERGRRMDEQADRISVLERRVRNQAAEIQRLVNVLRRIMHAAQDAVGGERE